MRIGVLTYHFANNYGAALQTYCLQAVLQEKGIETEIIDYQSSLQKSNNAVFLNSSSVVNIMKNIIRFPHYYARKERINKFNDFRKKLNITSEIFHEIDDVIEFAKNRYDAIVVGSDQVWNPAAPDFDDIYFRISKINIPVYAYAVSLGKAKKAELSKFRDDIVRFSDISVREDVSVDILRKVDNQIIAKGVLDPTLLLEKRMIENVVYQPVRPKENYIACYYLGRKDALKFKKAVKQLAGKFNLDVYYINANYGIASYGKNVISNYGPKEFLGFLKNARLVCTNSFHATALSIRFNIPFLSFENSVKDTRKVDLLRRLGIVNRLVENFDISNIETYELPQIDFEERLDVYRNVSLDFFDALIQKCDCNQV